MKPAPPVTKYVLIFLSFRQGFSNFAQLDVLGKAYVININYLRKFKTIKLSYNIKKISIDHIRKVCSLGISSFITQMAVVAVVTTENNTLSFWNILRKSS